MIKDNAVLYCLEDAAEYLGVSNLHLKRFLQKGDIRYCQNLSTPVSEVFVLRSSIERHLDSHYFKTAVQCVDGESTAVVSRMPMSRSDVIQTENLGYLSFETVHEWGVEIENTWQDADTYEARVFESFNGTKFSVFELDRDGENEWSIQPNRPLEFPFTLGKDGLLSNVRFSVEELDRVKANLAAHEKLTTDLSDSSANERSVTTTKRWKNPAEFFAYEDNFTWRPEEGRKAWWQVELTGGVTSNKKYFYRALLLYFLYMPEAPNPSIDDLLVFMRAYKPSPEEDDPLWNLKELRGQKAFSLDGSENYQPHGNMRRSMLSILKTRKTSKQ